MACTYKSALRKMHYMFAAEAFALRGGGAARHGRRKKKKKWRKGKRDVEDSYHGAKNFIKAGFFATEASKLDSSNCTTWAEEKDTDDKAPTSVASRQKNHFFGPKELSK